MKYRVWLVSFLTLLPLKSVIAETALARCLLSKMSQVDDSATISELKTLCRQQIKATESVTHNTSAIGRRYQLERQESNPFFLLPHRPNYLILSNNLGSTNETPFNQAFPDKDTHFQP